MYIMHYVQNSITVLSTWRKFLKRTFHPFS